MLLLVGLLCAVTSFAQYPNWGWGPAITTSLSGATLTCTTFDPVLQTNKTTTISSVDMFINNDGVVATVSSAGMVKGVIYDVNLGTWKQSQFSGNTGNTIQNSHGVISFVSAAGTVGAATYDAHAQVWKWNSSFSSNTGNTVINQDGVVAWVSSSGTVGAALYDPAASAWKWNSSFSSNTGNTIQNIHGVVGWVSASGTVGGAVYDPAAAIWKWNSSFSSNSGNALVNFSGVLAWISNSGTIGGAVYDPDASIWKWNSSMSSSSNNTNLGIQDGTIYWTGSSGSQQYGYNIGSKVWQNNYNTDIYCKYFSSHSSGDAPLLTYLWCMSIGANSFTHTAGDGHTIFRRWGWKQYDTPGTYTPSLVVANSIGNTTCNLNVTVNNPNSVEEHGPFSFNIYPNPITAGSDLTVETAKPLKQVRVLNALGAEMKFQSTGGSTSQHRIQCSGWPLGLYFVEVILSNDERETRPLIVQ